MEKQYCFTSEEHFQLAGSGGGSFVGPGFYYFDEDKDRYVWRNAAQAERQAGMQQHLREHYSGQTLEIFIKYKDDSYGCATYSGKAAGEMAARDLFYCLHERRDAREFKLKDTTREDTLMLYHWRDGEALP